MNKYLDNGNKLGILANDIYNNNLRTKQLIFNRFHKTISNLGEYHLSNEWEGIIANELNISNNLLQIIVSKLPTEKRK